MNASNDDDWGTAITRARLDKLFEVPKTRRSEEEILKDEDWCLRDVQFFADLFCFFIRRPAEDMAELDAWYQANRGELPPSDDPEGFPAMYETPVYFGWRLARGAPTLDFS